MKYANPVLSGFHPDPSVCRVGDDYYLVTSSFEFFPGVPVFHSRDLVHWEPIGHCLSRESQLKLDRTRPSGGIYAPTLRYREGVFHMTTTHFGAGGNFIVSARDPAGPWSDPVRVAQGGIDPSLFFDEDGKAYFTSNCGAEGRPGIAQAEVDVTTGRLLSPTRFLWGGTGGRYPEAPHLYRIHGMYYLLLAEGGTEYGHMATVARSASPWGPFESCPRNPILTHRNRGECEIPGTGHGDLVQAGDGSWWMVFHAFRTSRQYFHHLGRETFLAPVEWDSEGWPVVNRTGTVAFEVEVERLPGNPVTLQHPAPREPVRDDFDGSSLRFCWNFLRSPAPGSWQLDSEPSCLTLKGTAVTLDDIDSPAFVGRRQQHFDCRAATRLRFAPGAEGEEAGLTVFYDADHHYEIGVTKAGASSTLFVRKTVGDLKVVVAQERIAETSVVLAIEADRFHYSFGFGTDGSSLRFLCKGETQYVSTEATACSFTGVYLGLYATGNGRPCRTPAHFDWFDYEPL